MKTYTLREDQVMRFPNFSNIISSSIYSLSMKIYFSFAVRDMKNEIVMVNVPRGTSIFFQATFLLMPKQLRLTKKISNPRIRLKGKYYPVFKVRLIVEYFALSNNRY
jgi:hypothetical protein